jgi:hypothetical protein
MDFFIVSKKLEMDQITNDIAVLNLGSVQLQSVKLNFNRTPIQDTEFANCVLEELHCTSRRAVAGDVLMAKILDKYWLECRCFHVFSDPLKGSFWKIDIYKNDRDGAFVFTTRGAGTYSQDNCVAVRFVLPRHIR